MGKILWDVFEMFFLRFPGFLLSKISFFMLLAEEAIGNPIPREDFPLKSLEEVETAIII